MKSLSAQLILACLGVATAWPSFSPEQTVLGDYDGFSLDLAARRLVQMEGQAPVWMTELQKVFALLRVHDYPY